MASLAEISALQPIERYLSHPRLGHFVVASVDGSAPMLWRLVGHGEVVHAGDLVPFARDNWTDGGPVPAGTVFSLHTPRAPR